MAYIIVAKAFKDEQSGFTAVKFEFILEKMVSLTLEILKRKYSQKSLLFQYLENKAVSMIWEVQQTLDPALYESVREMNPRVLWTIYWRAKCNPMNKHMLFLDLLIELNKNPPFAMAFG